MLASKTVASLLVFAGVGFATQYDRYAPIRRNITWSTCDPILSAPSGFVCAEFDIPMDYANATRGKATLALIKYSSTVTPRKGTIFVNPGECSL